MRTALRRSHPEFDIRDDRYFMALALKEASDSFAQGGIPVGSVLVRAQTVIGQGHNQRVQMKNPILHGEMDCMTNAGRQRSYSGTALYTTLSPCMMCAGTILQFKIPRVVIGENRNFGGNEEFLRSRDVEVIVMDDQDCTNLMRRFINERPEIWAEDIGHDWHNH